MTVCKLEIYCETADELSRIAQALKEREINTAPAPAPAPTPAKPDLTDYSEFGRNVSARRSFQSEQTGSEAPVAPAAPVAPVAPVTPAPTQVAPAVPVTPAPAITLEQVSRAGADLIAANPACLQTLNRLLQKYGAISVTDLPADQIGAFATELRGLGAKI